MDYCEPLSMGQDHIGAVPVEGGYAHFDDSTRSWWIVSRADVILLGRMLANGVPDAYSVWCSKTSGEEQPKGWVPKTKA